MIYTVLLLSAKKWLDKDVDLDWVKGQTFSVVGYGIQGIHSSEEYEGLWVGRIGGDSGTMEIAGNLLKTMVTMSLLYRKPPREQT